MSKHGRVIISRMMGLIGEYEAGTVRLRGLVDDLGSMYESLDPSEQPPEREWLDVFIPLDRAVTEGEGRDRREIHRQIGEHLGHLKQLLTKSRPAA